MKHNKHRFVVTVKTTGTKRYAKDMLLVAFARREPDGCEFTLAGKARARSGKVSE